MKRTDLVTYEYGKTRRVYMAGDGRIYYRYRGQWFGTFINYCKRYTDNAIYTAEYDYDAKVNPWVIVRSWYECGDEGYTKMSEVIARCKDDLDSTFYILNSLA